MQRTHETYIRYVDSANLRKKEGKRCGGDVVYLDPFFRAVVIVISCAMLQRRRFQRISASLFFLNITTRNNTIAVRQYHDIIYSKEWYSDDSDVKFKFSFRYLS